MRDEQLLWWVKAWPIMLGSGLVFGALSGLLTNQRGIVLLCSFLGLAFGLWVYSRNRRPT